MSGPVLPLSFLLLATLVVAVGLVMSFGDISHAGTLNASGNDALFGQATPTPGCTPSGTPRTLYAQTDNAAAVATNSQNFEPAFDQFDSQVADDFDIAAGQIWSITQVNVAGQYHNGTGGPADSVNVFFYPNSGTLPGAPAVCTYTGLAYTGGSNFNIELPTPCVMSGGRFWVSVQANMNFNPNGQWFWVDRTMQSKSAAAYRNPGGGYACPGGSDWVVKSNCISPTFPDQIFSIIGTTLVGCPTPTPTPTLAVTPTPTPTPGCRWALAADYPINIADEAVVTVGNTMYVFGGTSNNTVIRTSMKFDGTTWTPIANLPFALRGLAAVTDGTNIYLINGENNVGIATGSLTRYNPAANNYLILASPTTPTTASAAVLLNGKIYRIGGSTLPGTTNTVDAYSIASGSWTQVANFPRSVAYAMAVSGNGVLYAGGGVDETGTDSLKIYSYDPVLNTWSNTAADLPASPAPHWGAASALLGGRWTIGPGGSSGSGSSSAIQLENGWTQLPDAPAARYRLGGAALGDSFYALGGDPPMGTVKNQKLTCFGATPVPSPTPTPTPSPTPACLPPPLYDNGGLLTDPGAGFEGADASRVQSALGMGILGYVCNIATGRRIADDFTVPAGGWALHKMSFYAYQTGSTTTSTFTDARLQIWNGPPNGGGTVIFGDLTTNRLESSTFSNIYRVPDTDLMNNQRPLMRIIVKAETMLPAGTYWVDVEFGGDAGFAGPFVAPVTILGQTGKPGANAIQWNGSAWAPLIDVAPQDMPFKINETICGSPTPTPTPTATPTPTPSPNPLRSRADFDGDGITDISVFRPSEGNWYLQRSTQGFTGVHFGDPNDILTPGDFDGDGKTDVAVWRPSNGTWYRLNSSNGTTATITFGTSGDIPQSGDFDGDGRDDIAVFRPSNGTWYRLNSSNGQFLAVQFGQSGDLPVGGDYDGDGRDDVAVFRPSDGTWYRLNSSGGQFVAVQFGLSTDKPTPADYDDDNREDISVFRPSDGNWYRLNSSNGAFVAINFGLNGDVPVPGDYDGDNRDDQAVYRAGTWYLNRSTSGFTSVPFGTPTDIPVPSKYIP